MRADHAETVQYTRVDSAGAVLVGQRGQISRDAALACLVTVVLWASIYAGIRASLGAYSPGHLILLRLLIGSAVLGCYAGIVRMRRPSLHDIPVLLLSGLLGISINNMLLATASQTVTAGAASLLANLAPVFTALFAVVFLGERLRLWGWCGILISFVGVATIAVGEGREMGLSVGAGLVVLGALAQSASFVIQKPVLARYGPLELTCYTIWSGTACLLIFFPGLPEAVMAAPLGATMSVVYLGIFPTAVAYGAWAFVLARQTASSAASFLYLIPPVAILIGWIWLGEVPSPVSLGGGVMALIGVVLVNRLGRPAASPSGRRG